MADHSVKAQNSNFYGILGLHKSASLGDIAKAYKNLVCKWNHPDRNLNKAEAEHNLASINEAFRVLSARKREEDASKHGDNKSPENSNHYRVGDSDNDELVISSPTLIFSTSKRITPSGTPRKFGDGSGHRKTASIPSPREFHGRSSSGAEAPTTPTSADEMSSAAFTKMASKRMPIIYSHTTARKKGNPVERKLECTLEELCRGAGRKVNITRNVISAEGLMVEQEEVLKIKIKPGWKKGTKITFEGKGDERPGLLPADLILVIDEKRHPIYKREGDDLELGVEIPLVQALTGCDISVPLLGGEQMNVSVDDIIVPGYEKRIPGQGMPISKEDGRRGDLVLKFLVEFPTELSMEQRSMLTNVLEECF